MVQRAVSISLVACVAGLGTLRAAEDVPAVVLARDGQTAYAIALARDASAAEKTAAAELRHYLHAVTGAQFPLVTPEQAAGQPLIAVGPGAARTISHILPLERLGDDGLGHDGIVLKTIGNALVLTGAEDSRRGTLYAVYEFLESIVGVRWWTKDEEFVPEKPTLLLAPLDVRYTPPFLYREVFSWGMMPGEKQWGYDDSDAAAVDWPQHRFAARLRNNGHGTAMPASLGGCYMPLGWCHTFYPFLPPETYFGEHPEWYSEIDGKRTADHAQLCMTNDAMLAEFARNVLEKVRQQPNLGIVVVTMNDWFGNCQCATCKAMDEAEDSPMGSLLYGVNTVAAAVEAEFPEFLVATHAYLYARKPPKTIRPRDNVLIWYCVIERAAGQPIDSDTNRTLMSDLEGWSKVAPKLFVWDYTMNLYGPFTAHPNQHVFGPDFRTYRDHHTVGVFCEGESCGLTHAVELKVYLMAHLLWDPSKDEKQLTDEFLQGYYGAAAPMIDAWYALVREQATNVRLTWNTGPEAPWLGLDAMNRGAELFEQAETVVAGDPVLEARVRRARLALDHQWVLDYSVYRREAEHAGKPFRGPPEAAQAVRDLTDTVLAETQRTRDQAMTGVIQACVGGSYDAYLQRVTARATIKPGPLPPRFAELPRERVIDMDESLATVFDYTGASIVEDSKASNGMAMRVPRADQPSWAVQAKTTRISALGGYGRYHIYAVVRCEMQAESGQAFVGGVWDDGSRQGLGAVSFPIGKPGPVPTQQDIDANPEIRFATISSGAAVTDGEYHTYDFGVYDLLTSNLSVWVGTTTGDMYVDRFILVREP